MITFFGGGGNKMNPQKKSGNVHRQNLNGVKSGPDATPRAPMTRRFPFSLQFLLPLYTWRDRDHIWKEPPAQAGTTAAGARNKWGWLWSPRHPSDEIPHRTILSWLFRCALRKYTGISNLGICLCRVLLPWPYELKGRWIAPSWFCLCAHFIAKRTVSVISYYSWFLSQGKGWKMEVDRKTPTWRASGTNTMACSHLDFAAETFTPTIYLKWRMIFAWLHLLSIWYVLLCFTTQLFPEHFPITCSGPLSCTIITFQPLSLLGYSTQAKTRFGPHICK